MPDFNNENIRCVFKSYGSQGKIAELKDKNDCIIAVDIQLLAGVPAVEKDQS